MTKKEHRPDVVFMHHIDNEGNLRLTPLPSFAHISLKTANIPIKLDFGEYKETGSTITPSEIAALLAEYRTEQGNMHSIGYTVADDSEDVETLDTCPSCDGNGWVWQKVGNEFGWLKRRVSCPDCGGSQISEGDNDND